MVKYGLVSNSEDLTHRVVEDLCGLLYRSMKKELVGLEITLASPIREHFCMGWITFCGIIALSNLNSETDISFDFACVL